MKPGDILKVKNALLNVLHFVADCACFSLITDVVPSTWPASFLFFKLTSACSRSVNSFLSTNPGSIYPSRLLFNPILSTLLFSIPS